MAMSSEGGDSVVDLLGIITGTPHRCSILRETSNETKNLRTLSEDLGVPRTTLKHNLEKLIEHDLVENTLDNEYRPTTKGDIVLGGIEAYEDHVRAGFKLQPFFSCVPRDSLGVDQTALKDAEIIVTRRAKPHAPAERLANRLRNGSSVQGFLPALPPLSEPELEEFLIRDSTDLVLASCAYELLEEELPNLVTKIDGTVGTTSDGPPFGIVMIDDQDVLLEGVDRNNKPHALVETDDSECYAWAQRKVSSLVESTLAVA